MSGVKGRSGRNRKTLEEISLAGTLRKARHLAQPTPGVDPAVEARKYQTWRRKLDQAKAPAGPNPIDAYALQVASGKLPAGKYHRLACQRHLKDREAEVAGGPWRLDMDRVARFVLFTRALRHYKGPLAGKPFTLYPYQVFRLGSMFGWTDRETGVRRFRRGYHEIPRKNGKTFEAAAVALYATFYLNEQGAEGYCAATKKDQARRVFDDCQAMVRQSILRVGLSVLANNIHDTTTMSKLQPLGADADSTDGLNPSCLIIDEFHAHKDRRLIDVLETATGGRREPVDMRITTAGDDPVSPGGDEHQYAIDVLESAAAGTCIDDRYFAFIAHADPEDDWTSPATWEKANPNYPILDLADITSLCAKAIHMPAAAAQFKQKRLNLWVNTKASWLSMEKWREGQKAFTLDDLRGQPCYVGVDLASRLDLAAMVALFPPGPGRVDWRFWCWAWKPGDTLVDHAHRDRAPYQVWAQQGFLQTPAGTSLKTTVVREALAELRRSANILQLGYDAWHGHDLIHALIHEDGFPEDRIVEVSQTFKGMAEAAAMFEGIVLAGQLNAGGNPLVAWCASNTVVETDGKGNIQPTKKHSRGRIDPIVAGVTALACQIRHNQAPKQYQILVFGGAAKVDEKRPQA